MVVIKLETRNGKGKGRFEGDRETEKLIKGKKAMGEKKNQLSFSFGVGENEKHALKGYRGVWGRKRLRTIHMYGGNLQP